MEGGDVTLEFREEYGSTYLYENGRLREMVDWDQGMAFAFNWDDKNLLKRGSLQTISEWALKANQYFTESWHVGYVHITQRVPVEDLNQILRTGNMAAFLAKYILPVRELGDGHE
jgi:hypothetical protein